MRRSDHTQPVHPSKVSQHIGSILLAVVITYALGILMMVLAYVRPTGYAPPLSEYFTVPLLLGSRHPLTTGAILVLLLVLVHVCRTVAMRRRAQ